jgi:hypothetical protein
VTRSLPLILALLGIAVGWFIRDARAREAMTREALHLCRTAPPVEPQEAPQHVKWGAVGFLGGVAASALTIIAITRGNP